MRNGFLALVAVAGAVCAAESFGPACVTHQCEPLCVQYGAGPIPGCHPGNPDASGNAQPIGDVFQDGDSLVWESAPGAGPWLDFPGQMSAFFLWPEPFFGHVPTQVDAYVAADAQNPQNGFVGGAGYVAEISNANSVGVWVTNQSCAHYGLRVVARTTAPKLTVFGGFDGSSRLADTWTFNGKSWLQSSTSSFPPARSDAAMATLRGTVVLFGGFDGTSVLGDTWTWDGTTWTQEKLTECESGASPPPRLGHAMATLDKVVLFGGFDGGSQLGDTWTWDGECWTEALQPQDAGAGPPARSGAAMASAYGRVVLFGGYDGGARLGDAWTWDGKAWSQWRGTGPSPSARSGAAFASFRGGAVLFGGTDGGTHALGDTWVWNGGGWAKATATSPSTPDARFGAAAASLYDDAFVLGGTSDGTRLLGDVWVWDGTTWTERTQGPPARVGGAAGGP